MRLSAVMQRYTVVLREEPMRVGLFRLASLFLCLAIAVVASAQYGHPLKGTWSGDWGTSKDSRNRVLLELNWDGKAITGTINPGPDAVPLRMASLDPTNWTVRFEADGKDRSGNAIRYVIEGKLQNLGSYYRTITGTWSQGAAKGDFKINRN
jgi:hypothetical protein